jgi:hypothetical protein
MSLTHPARRQTKTPPGTSANWRRLSDIIAERVAEIDAALAARDEATAAAAHAEMLDAQHEQRLRETVRRYNE